MLIPLKKIINTTPHALTMRCGETGSVYSLPPCGTVLSAKPAEQSAGTHLLGAELVRVSFEPDEVALSILARLETEHPGSIIVGSIISAQAFPGRVFALVPVAGYERVPPEQKQMRDDKFTTY